VKKQDAPGFIKWALIGAIAGIGVVGTFHSWAQAQRVVSNKPTVAMDGMRISGEFKKDAWPHFDLVMHVTNVGPSARDLNWDVTLLQQVFNGSPLTRVVRPTDTKRTVLETKRMRVNVPVGRTGTYTLKFDAVAETPGPVPKGSFPKPVTYLATLDGVTGMRMIGFISPPPKQ
jgi:hypothetical protein